MKVHFSDWNNVLQDCVKIAGNCDPLDADALVLFNDVRGSYKDIAEVAKKAGKKVYVVQHGRAATRDYKQFPLIADKFLAWGKADLERMTQLGYGDRTEIVGCPITSRILKPRPHDGKYVVFIPINTNKEEPENLQVYYKLLELKYQSAGLKLANLQRVLAEKWEKGKQFKDISDINVVAKLLPRHEQQLYHGDTFVSNPDDPRHSEYLFEILSMADCVVTLDESSTEILVMAADIPVVCCDIFEYRDFMKGIDKITTDGVYHCDLESLNTTVKTALRTPAHKQKERAAIVEHELSVSLGDATQNILRAIGYLA